MGLTQVPMQSAPTPGLKIVRLDGETIIEEINVSLNENGQLVGVIDGTEYLLSVPIFYDPSTGSFYFLSQSDVPNLIYYFIAPSADNAVILRLHDSLNAAFQIVMNSRNSGSVDTLSVQVVSTAGATTTPIQMSRSTGRVTFPTILRFAPRTAPSSPLDGDVYYDSGTNKLRVRANGAWVDLH